MGCVSSKLLKKQFYQEEEEDDDYESCRNHVVSLTSTTYGALKLDIEPRKTELISRFVLPDDEAPEKVVEELEVINAWELMGDLEDEEDEMGVPICSNSSNKSPIKSSEVPQFLNKEGKNAEISKKGKRFLTGKENKNQQRMLLEPSPSPKQALKPFNYAERGTLTDLKSKSFRKGSKFSSSSKRSLGPLFDPELIESIERELNEESGEHNKKKKIVSPRPINQKCQDSVSTLESFEEKCPPGGENAVVIYTTTLRGIRKTFEDCNAVRSIIESYQIRVMERDISMHLGFREELRNLMEKKQVKVPVVFVKGRLIGGAEEVMKMDEEGKLGALFRGVPRAATAGCAGCGGVRFIVCMDCSGSCKVLDGGKRKMVKCEQCNENGLIQCPICC